jgi:maltooligosyltrehalose trehalohydrolase
VLRFFGREHPDRLLVVNLGSGLELGPVPEPLMAPPLNCRWEILWSSEDLRYGGSDVPALDTTQGLWRVTGNSPLVLIPVPN